MECDTIKYERKNRIDLFAQFFNNTLEPIFIYNFSMKKLIDCNLAAERLFKYTKSEFLKLDRHKIIWLDHPDMIAAGINVGKLLSDQSKLIEDGQSFRNEEIFKAKDGTAIYCETVAVPTNRVKGEAIISLKDNTALYFSNKKQKRINKELNLIQDQSPFGMVQFDLRGRVINLSKYARELLGYANEDIQGLSMADFLPKKGLSKLLIDHNISNTIKTHKYVGLEIKKQNGQILLVNGLTKVISNENGTPKSVITFFNDISIQRVLEKANSEKEFELKALLDNIPDRIIMLDAENKIVQINQRAIDSIKFTMGRVLKVSNIAIEDILYIDNPKDRKIFLDRIAKVKKGESTFCIRPSMLTTSGSKGYSHISYDPIKNIHGKINGTLITGKNITELKNQEALLKTIINSAPDSILAIDKDYNVLALNKKCQDEIIAIDGIKLEVGFDLEKNIPPKLFKDWKERIFDKVFEGNSFRTTVSHDLQGSKMYAENNYAPITNAENEIIGCIEIARDITDEFLADQESKRNNEWLRELVKNSPHAVIINNPQGEIELFNEKASEHFKFYNISLSKGALFKYLLPLDQRNTWQKRFEEGLKKCNSNSYGIKRDEKEQVRYFQVNQNPMINDKGEVIGIMETIMDITELSLAKIEAEKRENILKTVINNIPDGLMMIDEDLFVTKTNMILVNELQKKLGVSILENEYLNIRIENHAIKQIYPLLKKALNGEKQSFIHEFEDDISGEIQYTQIDISKSLKIKNEKASVILMSRNITEIINKQNEISASRKRYKDIFEHSHQAILLVDIYTKEILDCNRSTLKILGFKNKKTLQEYKIRDFVSTLQFEGKAKDDFLKNTRKKIQENNKISFKVNGHNIKGEKFIAEVTALKEGDRLTIFASNITEKYHAEQELSERKQIYETLIDNSFDGIDILSISGLKNEVYEGTLLRRNERMNFFFNNSKKPFLTSENLLEICPVTQPNGKNSKEFFNENFTELIKKGRNAHEWQLMRENELIDVIIKNQLLIANDKLLLVRACQDITDSKRQEKIIKNQMKELYLKTKELQKYIESNLQLENFAYIASHDLKAPLRSVSSFAYLLKQNCFEALNQKGKNYLNILISSAQQMQLLIDDLLLLSRINTQKTNFEKIDLNRLIKILIVEIDENIQTTKTEIKILNLPKQITLDKIKIKQLYQNLILNAIKFTNTDKVPRIEIGCKELPRFFEFYVKDNGIGIKPEHFNKVFGLFEKLHSNDLFAGTGLGLTICKKIVEQHRGKIWIDSDGKSGSIIKFLICKEL